MTYRNITKSIKYQQCLPVSLLLTVPSPPLTTSALTLFWFYANNYIPKKCQWVKKHNMLINTWSFYINTQPFNGRWSGTTRVGRYQKKLTLSHPSWSSDILYQHPPFTTIHSILCVQFTCLTVLFDSLSRSSLVFLLVLGPLHHTPCISSPSHYLLFAEVSTLKSPKTFFR